MIRSLKNKTYDGNPCFFFVLVEVWGRLFCFVLFLIQEKTEEGTCKSFKKKAN